MKEKFNNFMREISERAWMIIAAINLIFALVCLAIGSTANVGTFCIMAVVCIGVDVVLDEIKNIKFKF